MKDRFSIPYIRRSPKLVIEPQRLTKILSGTRKIFIAVPSNDASIKIDTARLLLDGHIDALINGWAFDIHTNMSKPISAARNILFAEFMASDCTDIAWVDHDLTTQPGALASVINQPVDFAGAVAPYRGDPYGFPVQWDSNNPLIQSDDETGLIKVNGIPFGFVRMTRAACERMVAAYSHLEYDHPGCPNNIAWRLFSFEMYGRSEWSEDMVFCRRWREIGGEVWIDPTVRFSHIGDKAFTGSLYDFLLSRPNNVVGREHFATDDAYEAYQSERRKALETAA